MDLDIGHLYKLMIFLSPFMSGQIHIIHKVSENTESRGLDLGLCWTAGIGPKN